MIKNLKLKIKNSCKGITLVEILVAITIITLFSTILILDYPKMRQQFALSRAAYRFIQDVRAYQDMAMSGVRIKNAENEEIKEIDGYGVYVSARDQGTDDIRYIIYADINGNQQFDDYGYSNNPDCSSLTDDPIIDCIIKTVYFNQDSSLVYISVIYKAKGDRIEPIDNPNLAGWASINFNPPNPTTTITTDLNGGDETELQDAVEIQLALSYSSYYRTVPARTIYINKSGLVSIQ